MGFIVDELFAFIATDDDGDEGVMAAMMDGTWYPLVAADLVRAQQFTPLANAVSKEAGVEYKLKHFKLLGDVSDEYLEQFKELPDSASGSTSDNSRAEGDDKQKSNGGRKGNGSE